MDAEKRGEGLPLGPDWETRIRVSEGGRLDVVYEPPGLVSRFWPWPAGIAVFIGLTAIPDSTPLVYFLGGAAVVAFRNELRMQTVGSNHRRLLEALRPREEEG